MNSVILNLGEVCSILYVGVAKFGSWRSLGLRQRQLGHQSDPGSGAAGKPWSTWGATIPAAPSWVHWWELL